MGVLVPVLNKRDDLSIINGVLLYNQLIHRLMDSACPAWRSAVRTHVWRLQVLQSKCLRLLTGAPWYPTNRHIHEYFSVLLFADHVRALTASFDSNLADAGNSLFRQLARYLTWPRVYPVARRVNREPHVPTGQSRPSLVDGQVDQTNIARH
jgi:hypothetical protein